MKTIIFGVALGSLLIASSVAAQAVRPSSQWAPVAPASAVALRDTTVDVGAGAVAPRSWRLGEFTLLTREDRDVKLRFTMMSVPPPPIPAAVPRGQALATVGIDVIVLARR